MHLLGGVLEGGSHRNSMRSEVDRFRKSHRRAIARRNRERIEFQSHFDGFLRRFR